MTRAILLPLLLASACAFPVKADPEPALDWRACDIGTGDHDPSKEHVRIDLESWVPEVRLKAERAEEPELYLNGSGLHHGLRLLCPWPKRRFDRSRSANMVLGFDGERVSSPCPEGSPFVSGFGDGGRGSAVLCLAVEKRLGGFVETSYRGKKHFLELSKLPPGAWRLVESRRQTETRERKTASAVERDGAWQAFLSASRRCLRREDPRPCLVPWVTAQNIYFPEKSEFEPAVCQGTDRWHLTPELFLDCLWWAEHPSGQGRLWQELEACLAPNNPAEHANESEVLLPGKLYQCRIEREAAGWRLSGISQAP